VARPTDFDNFSARSQASWSRPLSRPLSRRAWLASILAAAAVGCRRREARDHSGAPSRIASRTVFADEVLWALGDLRPGLRERVIGLSPMVDDPRYSMVADAWPEATPRLGLNPEELLALAPDLVILASFSAPEYRAAIEGSTAVLVLDDFTGFEGYLDNVRRIGEALAEPDACAELIAQFEARRAELEARRPPTEARPTVLAWDYGYVPGSATSFDDAATSAGFLNLPAREGITGHQRLDAEQLLAWDPEWIVVGCSDSCAAATAKLGSQPGFTALRAVKSKQVIAIEAPYLASVGEGMLELSARMQAALLDRSRG
jgi:ABC-type Fe3+-hydroxamate transport system substrate-binding protein